MRGLFKNNFRVVKLSAFVIKESIIIKLLRRKATQENSKVLATLTKASKEISLGSDLLV